MVTAELKSELYLLIDDIEEEVLLAVKALLERCTAHKAPLLTPAQALEVERRLALYRNGETELHDPKHVFERIRNKRMMGNGEA